MKHLLILCILGEILFMTGCASIVSKSKYPVSITSEPSGAEFMIEDTSGRTVVSGKTPDMVDLKAGDGYFSGADYTIIMKHPGYREDKVMISRNLDGWYLAGNLFFGGLIGWLIVDPITGAMWKLEEDVFVPLKKEVSSGCVPYAPLKEFAHAQCGKRDPKILTRRQ